MENSLVAIGLAVIAMVLATWAHQIGHESGYAKGREEVEADAFDAGQEHGMALCAELEGE